MGQVGLAQTVFDRERRQSGGNQYFHTLGTGGEAYAEVWGDVRLRSVFEFRQKNFSDARDRPLSRGLNGSDKLETLLQDIVQNTEQLKQISAAARQDAGSSGDSEDKK